MTIISMPVDALRPTQMAVGMRLVKLKAKNLRQLERRPQELVNSILANPIRVVLGPKQQAFVIDHHHLGLALLKEKFETAPLVVEADLSTQNVTAFWKEMQHRHWLRPVDHKGRPCRVADIPQRLEDLRDDPYRSLAGFVRMRGGFTKTSLPFMEFQWADYFRPLLPIELLRDDFDKAVKRALKLVHLPAASHLPGYLAAVLPQDTPAGAVDD
ncbi:MAG: chromosome partitioning protein ParB [Proteobacteria bacterium]|nr:chromosome partitioning protein ParB [Pseudomonadota bacterium]